MLILIQQMQLDLCVEVEGPQRMSLNLEMVIDPGRRSREHDSAREQLRKMQDAVVSQDPTALFLALLKAYTGDVYVKRDPNLYESSLHSLAPGLGRRALDLEEEAGDGE